MYFNSSNKNIFKHFASVILLASLTYFQGVSSLFAAELLTLEQAVHTAKVTSPDLQSSQAQTKSARYRAEQSLAPALPSISYTYQDMNTPYHGLSVPASRVIGLTQPINFPGKALLAHSSLSYQAKALEDQSKGQELQVSLNTKTAYFQLQISRENLNLNAEQHLLYERIFATAKRRYEAGAITQVDLLNAEVALNANDNDLADLKSAERQARAQLNLLIGRPVDQKYDIEAIKGRATQVFDKGQLQNKMNEYRNELRAARNTYEAANKSYRLAEMSLLPDFQLTAGTTYYDVPEASPIAANGGSHTYYIGLQATIPIWFLLDQRLGMSAAASDRAAAEANLQSVSNQSKLALEAAFDTYSANSEKIQNFEKHILPLTEQSLNLAVINYGAGKIDFQTLADAATARRTTRQTYLTTIMNLQISYSNIGLLIGEDL